MRSKTSQDIPLDVAFVLALDDQILVATDTFATIMDM
jgi:hypothetical protein